MEYILQHADTLTQTLGYFQTDCKSMTENSPRRLRIKDRYSHTCQIHIDREYQQIPKRRRDQAVPRKPTLLLIETRLFIQRYLLCKTFRSSRDRGYVRRPVMSPRAQVLGNLPKERPDAPTSPTYKMKMLINASVQSQIFRKHRKI